MTSYVLVDDSQGAQLGDGSKTSPAVLEQIASSIMIQVNRDFAAYWGIAQGGVTVRVASSASDVQPSESVVLLQALLTDAPNDIAYHDKTSSGAAAIVVGVGLCQTLTSAGNSLSCAISHEILESEGDRPCNRWVDDGNGKERALEVCDPVEGDTYEINGVSVSNFVTPNYFDPGAPAAYDQMQTLSAPFQVKNGYQVLRLVGGTESQIEGEIKLSKAGKAHPSSRTSRRGAKIAA